MTLPNATTTQWGLSTATPGQIVEGVDEINQCIAVILCTTPGSDPMRPLFGCGLGDLIDRPANVSGAAMAAAIDKALRIWEPRIKVVKITYQVMEENIRFGVSWQLKVGFGAGQAEVLLGLLDALVKSPLFEDLAPYLSAVLSTEDYDPLTTETSQPLVQE